MTTETHECPACGGSHALPQDLNTGRYWVSWWGVPAATDGIPWKVWITGQRFVPPRWSICAVIDAPSEDAVWEQVAQFYPDHERRFISKRPADWQPDGERFS